MCAPFRAVGLKEAHFTLKKYFREINLPFNSHHVRLRLCVGLGVGA
jgi:hypothetical protein